MWTGGGAAAAFGSLNAGVGGGGGGGFDWSKIAGQMGGGGGGGMGGGGSTKRKSLMWDPQTAAYLQAYQNSFGGGGGMGIHPEATKALTTEQKIADAGLASGASDVALIALLLQKLFKKKKPASTSYPVGSAGYETGFGFNIPGATGGY